MTSVPGELPDEAAGSNRSNPCGLSLLSALEVLRFGQISFTIKFSATFQPASELEEHQLGLQLVLMLTSQNANALLKRQCTAADDPFEFDSLRSRFRIRRTDWVSRCSVFKPKRGANEEKIWRPDGKG